MFWSKKEETKSTSQDYVVKGFLAQRADAMHDLEERVEKVIICNGVIDLYPEGADKEAAKEQAEKAKRLLLCAIGRYDDIVNQYNDALKDIRRNTTLNYMPILENGSSHALIENYYKNFYKRG